MNDYQPQPRVHVDHHYLFVDETMLTQLLKDRLVQEGDAPALYVPASDGALSTLRHMNL